MSPERVLAALETGAMISMTSARTAVERRAIAEFVAGKPFGRALVTTPSPQSMCPVREGDFVSLLSGPLWNGCGVNTARYQDASMAGFTAAGCRLKLKWAFGFPGDVAADAQPMVAGGRVFVGSQNGNVYALNTRPAASLVIFGSRQCAPPSSWGARNDSRSLDMAFIGDRAGNVYSVNAGRKADLENEG